MDVEIITVLSGGDELRDRECLITRMAHADIRRHVELSSGNQRAAEWTRYLHLVLTPNGGGNPAAVRSP